MKKFLISLFILAVLGGAAFFFGWAQLSVPPGAYGIISSKTHGVDSRPVRSGEFRWIWYKLIPTNVSVAVFRLEPVQYNFNVRNSLSSGKSYAAFAGIPPEDFTWEIYASLSFSLNPDSLVKLVQDYHIGSQESLEAYTKGLAEQIEGRIMRNFNVGDNTALLEELLKNGSSPGFEREISGQFPEIQQFSFVVKSAQFPDFALYNQIRGLYEDFVARQREYVSGALAQSAENRIGVQLRFDELAQYGELLTKYPVLLEYLALEKKEQAPLK